jgi:hypothetical protein
MSPPLNSGEVETVEEEDAADDGGGVEMVGGRISSQ